MVGVASQLHRCVVNIHVREFDLGGMLGEVLSHDFAPEDRGLEDVRFIDRADASAAAAGGVDRDLSDALNFAGLVDHGVDGL